MRNIPGSRSRPGRLRHGMAALPLAVVPAPCRRAINAWMLLALLGCGAGHQAAAADWRSDVAASRLEFIPTFERAPVPGVFREFDARVRLDPADPAAGRVEVSIAVSSADMGIPDVDREIRGADWFDYARFPNAAFQSVEVRRVDAAAGRYVARGTLALKGVQQLVEVPFAWSEAADSATMEGEFVLRRGVFGIGQGEWANTSQIGADVRVKFRLRLRKLEQAR